MLSAIEMLEANRMADEVVAVEMTVDELMNGTHAH